MIQEKVSKGNVIFVRDIGHLSPVLMNEFEKCQSPHWGSQMRTSSLVGITTYTLSRIDLAYPQGEGCPFTAGSDGNRDIRYD